MFQHTAARRRLQETVVELASWETVSTHSRAEAAAKIDNMGINLNECFNTQPRGGGCQIVNVRHLIVLMFQHTAARRRLPIINNSLDEISMFQHTAARRRLLMVTSGSSAASPRVSTHSRAEAAANVCLSLKKLERVSTHSRAEAAALELR